MASGYIFLLFLLYELRLLELFEYIAKCEILC